MNIDDLLRIAMERRASDLHLKVGNYPHLRIDGDLVPLTEQARVSAEDMLNMAFSMMSARQKQKFKETTEIDMAYGVAGLGRFRVNVFQQRGNVGLVLRVIPTKIRALDELYLPKIVEQVCDMASEVCCDPRGGGAQVELGGRQRALDSCVLGTGSHHPRQQREQGCGIAGGGEHVCLRHELPELTGRDSKPLLSRETEATPLTAERRESHASDRRERLEEWLRARWSGRPV